MTEVAFEQTSENFSKALTEVASTAEGRWFLEEYARIHRTADTRMILDKLEDMQTNLTQVPAVIQPAAQTETEGPSQVTIIKSQLEEIRSSIQDTRKEISAIKPRQGGSKGNIESATQELDAIVDSTEQATSDILAAAEALQTIAEELRANGTDEDICARIEEHATSIFMACSFQDITGQRTTKVMKAIGSLDQRINSMLQMWGVMNQGQEMASMPAEAANDDPRPDAHLLNGPQLDGKGHSQDDIDALLSGAVAPEAFDQNEAEEITDIPSADNMDIEIDLSEMDQGSSETLETSPESFEGMDSEDEFDLGNAEEEASQDDIDALFD